MKKFKSFSAYSKHLESALSQYNKKQILALTVIGQFMEKEAKHKIGHLQSGHGHYKDWAELADATKRDKERKGFVFNSDYNPLLRTGDLKNSIHFKVMSPKLLYLASSSQIMIYQELGTVNIPPRSVLGLTAIESIKTIQYVFSQFLVNVFSGEKVKFKVKK